MQAGDWRLLLPVRTPTCCPQTHYAASCYVLMSPPWLLLLMILFTLFAAAAPVSRKGIPRT
jgi:hypothetical protein